MKHSNKLNIFNFCHYKIIYSNFSDPLTYLHIINIVSGLIPFYLTLLIFSMIILEIRVYQLSSYSKILSSITPAIIIIYFI